MISEAISTEGSTTSPSSRAEHFRTCPLCEATCGLEVTVDGDASNGTVVAVLPSMIERGEGQLLMITRSAGNKVLPAVPLHSALRAGATHLVKNGAADVATHGLQVNVLGANCMDFLGFIAANKADRPEGLAKVVARVPMGSLGSVEEFAARCRAHLDGSCGFVTGQFVAHEGGWS